MLYSYKELKEKLKSNYQIELAIREGKYFKIEEGIYSSKPSANSLAIIFKKYPYAVLYGESAYYFYNLTDFIPNKIVLATRVKSKICSEHIKQVRLQDNLYNLGVQEVRIDEDIIRVYDKERMLIELARNKNKMGYDEYKEIVINYRKIADDLDIEKIEEYLKNYTNGDKLFEIIQNEVF